MTFSGVPDQQRGTTLSWATSLVKHRSCIKPCVLHFRSGGSERPFPFVLALRSTVVVGHVEIESDELMSDIDATIDLHSNDAQEWERKFHIVHGGKLGIDAWCSCDSSDKARLTHYLLPWWLASGWQFRVARLVAGGSLVPSRRRRCTGYLKSSEASSCSQRRARNEPLARRCLRRGKSVCRLFNKCYLVAKRVTVFGKFLSMFLMFFTRDHRSSALENGLLSTRERTLTSAMASHHPMSDRTLACAHGA